MTEPTPAELNESAMNHFAKGDAVTAAKQLEWALIGNPDYAEAWHNRAIVLKYLNDPFDALLCVDRALALDYDVAAFHNSAGVCWSVLSQFENAIDCYDNALTRDPNFAAAWHNKGNIAKICDNFTDAIAFYQRAVDLVPDNPDYHLSYGAALMAAGHLAEGWHEDQWRHKCGQAFARRMPLPNWLDKQPGEVCTGLIVYGEQGIGDVLHFIRFAPILREQFSMPVFVEVKKPLVELVRTMTGIDGVFAYGDPLPKDASHCIPVMSAAMPAGCNRIEDIPADVPYFHVSPMDSIASLDGFKIGLCWKSGFRPHQPESRATFEMKSMPTHFLQPLSKIEGVKWFSLQFPTEPLPFEMTDLMRDVSDMYDTARIIKSLDLVVTVDTSIVHLAGALGVSTIVMTPKNNCWRWFGSQFSSPWYPTVMQIRQPQPGDWPSVIKRVKNLISGLKPYRSETGINVIGPEVAS